MLNFSSNDYLGLSENRYLKNQTIKMIKKYGIGSGSSRLVSGNYDLHEETESILAKKKKSEDTKNAIKYFKNVIKKNHDHVKARTQLIKIYQKLNREKDVLRECEIIYMLDRSVYNSLSPCIKNKQSNNIAGKMRLNEWRGKKKIEFVIEDISLN